MRFAQILVLGFSLTAIVHGGQTPSPTTVGLSPAVGPPGDAILITGGSFLGTTQVTFAGHQAVFQVDSASAITAIVPLAATTGTVEVTIPSGSETSSQTFGVVAYNWNAVEDFSAASNPAGVWSYGWAPSLGGTFSLLTTPGGCPTGLSCWQNGLVFPNTAAIERNITPYTLKDQSVIVPNNILWIGAQGNAGIVRWTAPATGHYSIAGSFLSNDFDVSIPVNVRILANGSTSLFADAFSVFGETKSFSLSNLPLIAGTTIDFEAAYTSTPYNDNVALIATVSLLK